EKFFGGLGVPRHLASDCDGRIYVVCDDVPGARVLDHDGNSLADATAPESITGSFAPMSFAVDAAGRLHLDNLCLSPSGTVFDLDGNAIASAPAQPTIQFFGSGSVISGPLDSRIYRCQWHRVILTGRIRPGASVRVSTYTSEAVVPSELIMLPDLPWTTHPEADREKSDTWDCLIQSPPGRY